MKRLRLYMILFAVLVSLPLAFVAWRTYGALDQEARAQVRFFSERLLDEIETELAQLVRREEMRAVDEYGPTMVQNNLPVSSPLAGIPAETFVIGYFQNNPDGSFQTPMVGDLKVIPAAMAERVDRLEAINAIFNRRKLVARMPVFPAEKKRVPVNIAKQQQSAFADRYLKKTEPRRSKSVLGQERARVEEITVGQAMNLAHRDADQPESARRDEGLTWPASDTTDSSSNDLPAAAPMPSASEALSPPVRQQASIGPDRGRFQVEVAPLQTVAIDTDRVFIFRRIGIDGRIYRQGFVLRLQPFFDHLLADHYDSQPIARYARLILQANTELVADRSVDNNGDVDGDLVVARTFPAPFGFLSAQMHALSLPPSPARQTLTLALAILGIVVITGLATIYRSARAILDLSERRAQFVSAVTHELKTPLTNIRMYIEMLEQGIAATPEREQEYLGILSSEGARLSGLINNVLELSRLEKRTRRFDMQDGDLSDVLAKVQAVMAESLEREGFEMTIRSARLPIFAYDSDVLVQVLINLIENSIKFGRHLPQKQITIAAQGGDGWIRLTVSDQGPGIPRRSLKLVFDDFYRVDNALSRATGGTGIGLALVKKFILAMGGRIRAENNDGPGCTITISLPAWRKPVAH